MKFCEDCGTDFNDSDVDAQSGEEDRCQECIRSMRVGVSAFAVEEWVDRKIKRKAKREKCYEPLREGASPRWVLGLVGVVLEAKTELAALVRDRRN